jgi:hypothetical protein
VATNIAGTNNGADQTFTTSQNQPPLIVAPAPATPLSGQQVIITTTISDDEGINSASLSYRKAGDPSFVTTAMSAAGGQYSGAISPSAVTSRGIEYYITATDSRNLTSRSPSTGIFSIQVRINNENKAAAQPGSTAQTAYRLISVPFALDDENPGAVLGDDLGEYDKSKWRLYGINNGQLPYAELPLAGNFTPGRSFFLIVAPPDKTIDAGPGQSVRTDQPFALELAPGHNFIATPFNFSIPVGKLQLAGGGSVALRTFNGEWTPADAMTPWEGYYVANNNASARTLSIDPSLFPAAASKGSSDRWRLQISAQCGDSRDRFNFAGISEAADDGWDDLDLVEPPPIGDYVSVYFRHSDWQKPLHRYSDDMRSAFNANQRWNFAVESNRASEIVTLRFDEIGDFAAQGSVYLIDAELGYKQDLRAAALYQFQSRGAGHPKTLAVVAGEASFVEEKTAGLDGVPDDFVLDQNFPNPFNPETMIRFGLPRQSVVTLKIFDINGREVATLLDGVELVGGLHQHAWTGRNAQGEPVASGIYFCRLSVGSFTKVKKMSLVR